MHARWALLACTLAAGCGSGEPLIARARDAGAQTTDHGGALDGGTMHDAPQPEPHDAGAPSPVTSNPGLDGGKVLCETHTVQSSELIPDLLIVLDRSGSMSPDNNDRDTDRWGGSVSAIVEVTAALDETIHFGLMTFPAFTPEGGANDDDSCAPGSVNVEIGKNQGPAIAAALAAMDADGRTPTAASLEHALEVLGAPPPADSVAPKRYVLLVTDGDPNCSGSGGDGADEAARRETIAAIEALQAADIKTFVVGYQTAGTEFSQQLDDMAAAGGTGETMHRSVEDSAALAAVLEQLAGEVASCTFALSAPVEDPDYVRVSVGGGSRPFGDAANGWMLAPDGVTVELVGAACETRRAGAAVDVQVECAPVVAH